MLRVVLGMVIALSARDAVASCRDDLDDWTVLSGELAPGAACGTLVMTTDAGAARVYSGGEFWRFSVALDARREPVHVPYEIAFDVERLTTGPWRIEVQVLGVAVRISTNTIAFVGDPTHQVADFYEEHPELGRPGRHRVVVRQTRSEVAVFYDGKLLERHASAAPGDGTIALGLLGAPGQRTRIALHDVRIAPVSDSSARRGRTSAANRTPAPARPQARADARAVFRAHARRRASAGPT